MFSVSRYLFLQGAFGKGALIGFGLTTYTLLGLGVVCLTLFYNVTTEIKS